MGVKKRRIFCTFQIIEVVYKTVPSESYKQILMGILSYSVFAFNFSCEHFLKPLHRIRKLAPYSAF
jgi:hypothetical protein